MSWLTTGLVMTLYAAEPAQPARTPGSGDPRELTSVTVSRGGCEGTCPQETFRFARTGKATFSGRSYSKRQGDYVGRVSGAQFEALAKALVEGGLFDLTNSCDQARQAVDAAVCFTLSYVRGGKRFERTLDHADAWQLQRALDALADEVVWGPKPKGPSPRKAMPRAR